MAKKATVTKTVEEAPAVQSMPVQHDVDLAVEKRLVALYTLQMVDSEIDKIHIIRGELPMDIQDLEDEIEGLDTRLKNLAADKEGYNTAIAKYDREIAEQQMSIKRYEAQLDEAQNNRAVDSLKKEMEYADLEIQLRERRKKEAREALIEIDRHVEAANSLKTKNQEELDAKKAELDDIMKETAKDEARLRVKSEEQEQYIDDRYLKAYKRIRGAARNGLAVVQIDRNACAGCFAKIPPQRQMEIKMHRKVIVCEHCGRILVDDDIAQKAAVLLKKDK